MTDLILANPTLTAIALAGILFAFLDAIGLRERHALRAVTRRQQGRGAESNPVARLPVHDRWR